MSTSITILKNDSTLYPYRGLNVKLITVFSPIEAPGPKEMVLANLGEMVLEKFADQLPSPLIFKWNSPK